ncbi:MAG: uroporphyrinogen decarboxylase family protein [Verrucomicrobia bacterium]|nr:uroporphyrinogen decarboxylase family protein [Verrucomicrobiota bacterium]
MSHGSINSKELVGRALRGQQAPRPAAGPLAVHYCARVAGVSLRDYTLSPVVLSECVLRYYKRFTPDAVWLSADTWVNAEAMGAHVAIADENQPLGGVGPPAVQGWADLERIPPPDPHRQGRWPLMLEAVRRVNDAIGGEVFIAACFDQFPFSLACALMGLEHVLRAVLEEPALVEALMRKCSDYTLAYALALAEAGADMLSGGDSPAGLLGPTLYRRIALPFERRIIDRLHERVPMPVSLHICGDTRALLADLATTGADVLELDHQVDVAEVSQPLGPNVAIWGNLDPVAVLAQGTPNTVRQATVNLIRKLRGCGHARFVVSSGCTLAMETPAENLAAMFETVRSFAK